MPKKKAAYKPRKKALAPRKKVAKTAPKAKTVRSKKETEETKPVIAEPKPKRTRTIKKAVKPPFAVCAKAPALSALAYVVDDNTSKSATADEVAEGTGIETSLLETALSGILVRKGFVAKDKKGCYKLTEVGQKMLSPCPNRSLQ